METHHDDYEENNIHFHYPDRNLYRADDPKEKEDTEDDDEPSDWGETDPLDPPMSMPDPMDPSGPGSAV